MFPLAQKIFFEQSYFQRECYTAICACIKLVDIVFWSFIMLFYTIIIVIYIFLVYQANFSAVYSTYKLSNMLLLCKFCKQDIRNFIIITLACALVIVSMNDFIPATFKEVIRPIVSQENWTYSLLSRIGYKKENFLLDFLSFKKSDSVPRSK